MKILIKKRFYYPNGINMKYRWIFLGLIFLFVLWSPFVGYQWIHLNDLIAHSNLSAIFWKIRIPRFILAFMVGSAFALSGLIFQTIFHNPLVSPLTLGVSGAASLGSIVAMFFGLSGLWFGLSLKLLISFLFSIFTILIIFNMSRLKISMNQQWVLLCGIAFNFIYQSLILFLFYLSDFNESHRIIFWLMGNLEVVGYREIIWIMPIYWGSILSSFYFFRELDIMSLDENLALSKGVHTAKVRMILFVITSLLIGSIVSVCGPIGFIGIIIPHLVHIFLKIQKFIFRIPLTIFTGGIFLVLCDWISRNIHFPNLIPLGIITALIGGPFFLIILVYSNMRK